MGNCSWDNHRNSNWNMLLNSKHNSVKMNLREKQIKKKKVSAKRKILRNLLIVIAYDHDTKLVEKLPDATLRDIGVCFGISAQRARQIHRQEIKELY